MKAFDRRYSLLNFNLMKKILTTDGTAKDVARLATFCMVAAIMCACGGGGDGGGGAANAAAIAAAVTAANAQTPPAAQSQPPGDPPPGAISPDIKTKWATTWQIALMPSELKYSSNDTIRSRIRTSAGGTGVRVRVSNVYGTKPMVLDEVTIALPVVKSDDPTAINLSTLKLVTFQGTSAVSVPVGEEILSDPVTMNVAPLSDLMISMHFNGSAQYGDAHADKVTPLPATYVIGSTNATDSEKLISTNPKFPVTPFNGIFNISEVQVLVPQNTRSIIAMSDSITDGRGAGIKLGSSSEDAGFADIQNPWPAVLSRLANSGSDSTSVGNVAIGGNQLLTTDIRRDGSCCGDSLTSRFKRDVLSRNPTDIVLLAGLNDLREHSASGIIQAYQQLIWSAHANGIKVWGGVNTPIGFINDGGRLVDTQFYSTAKDATRLAINDWIKTPGNFDGVIDFSSVVGDATRPGTLGLSSNCYDPYSPIHLNKVGYEAMGTLAYNVMFGKFAQPAQACLGAASFPTR